VISALILAAAIAGDPREVNCTLALLEQLELSADSDVDIRSDVLSPQLNSDQIARFRAIKGCRPLASYASSDERVLWTWVCAEGVRNVTMEVAASNGQVELVVLDGQEVWPKMEKTDG